MQTSTIFRARIASGVEAWQYRENLRSLIIFSASLAPLVILGHWPIRSTLPSDDLQLRGVCAALGIISLMLVALVPASRRYALWMQATSTGTFLLLMSVEIVQTHGTAIEPAGLVLAIFGSSLLYPEAWSLFAIFALAFTTQSVFTLQSHPGTTETTALSQVCIAYMFCFVFSLQRIRSRRREVELSLGNEALQAEQIEFLRYHDAVTGLPNRARLIESLQSSSATDSSLGSLLAINVSPPQFSPFDGAAPRQEDVLNAVATHLHDSLGSGVRIYRGSGFSLLLWLGGTQVPGALDALAHQALEILSAPLTGLGESIYAKVAIATHVFTGEERAVSDVLDAMESVFTQTADQGSIVSLVPTEESDNRLERLRRLRSEFDTALQRGQFVLHYQPVLDRVGQLVEVEALVRWSHPELGLLPPDEFIGLAERTGGIIQLGDWVMRESARQAKLWSDDGLNVRVAFNVSCRQFVDETFLSRIHAAIESSGVDPHRLGLEVTETVAMEDVTLSCSRLAHCKGLGISLSLDDFGSGYSSLAYLRALPVDIIKIDRSFVSVLPDDPIGAEIAKAIIALAHSLGRTAHAEGVETARQMDWLVAANSDVFQGYFISHALPSHEIAPWYSGYLARLEKSGR